MMDSEKLNKTFSELKSHSEKLKNNIVVLSRVAELSNQLEKGVQGLEQGNQNFNLVKEGLRNSLKELNENVQSLKKENEKQVEKIIDSNKKFLRDFDDTVSSRLDRFSSDIQVAIRQERTGLQESLQNNIANQFNAMENRFNDRLNAQSKKISFLQVLLFCSIGLSAILILIIVFRN